MLRLEVKTDLAKGWQEVMVGSILYAHYKAQQ